MSVNEWTIASGSAKVRSMQWVLLIGFWWALQGVPPEVHVDPDTGDRYHLERPEGAARGRWPVPGWVVWAVGGAVVVGASATLVARIRRKRNTSR